MLFLCSRRSHRYLRHLVPAAALLLLTVLIPLTRAQSAPSATAPELVFLDTDIGDDIDDAFAVALALQSPELRILGITTTFGDTTLRVHLLHRLLTDTGHADIPIAAGPPTPSTNAFTQRSYAERDANGTACATAGEDARNLFTKVVRAHPHTVTLVALGPLTTVEFLIDRDPATFGLLERVVMMGGSIDHGYRYSTSGTDPGGPSPAEPEWNIKNSISGARALLRSGVPLTLLPLDSTEIPLDEVRRQRIFAYGSPLTDALTLLYHQWGAKTPILFDPLTIATILHPQLCPTEPLRLSVDDTGHTRREPGPPNAQVCLRSDREGFLDLLTERLVPPHVEPGPRVSTSGH